MCHPLGSDFLTWKLWLDQTAGGQISLTRLHYLRTLPEKVPCSELTEVSASQPLFNPAAHGTARRGRAMRKAEGRHPRGGHRRTPQEPTGWDDAHPPHSVLLLEKQLLLPFGVKGEM